MCKSKEELDLFFQNLYFTFFIEKINLDVKNYENPTSSFIKAYYKAVDLNIYKLIYYYIQPVEIETDDGLLLEEKKILNSYSNNKIQFDTASYSDEDSGLIGLFLYVDDCKHTVTRKYQKLQSLFANLGGVANLLMIVGGIFAKFQNTLDLKNSIINELYLFNEKNERRKIPTLNNIKFMNINQINSNFNLFCQENQKKQKLYMGFIEYIKLKFKSKFKFKASEKEKLFQMGEQMYFKEINIVEIMKKIQEIDKLKSVLFSKEQFFLFSLIVKPSICKTKEESMAFNQIKKARNNKIIMKQKNLSKMLHCFEYNDTLETKFQKSVKYLNENWTSEINYRILRFLDSKIIQNI